MPAIFFKCFLFVLIFISHPKTSQSANSSAKADSLINEFNNTTVATTKVDLLNALFENKKTIAPQDALMYAQEALALAKKINYPRGKINAYNSIATFHLLNYNIESAIDSKKNVLVVYQETKDKQEIINCIISIGDLYNRELRLDNAMAYYFDGLKLIEDWIAEQNNITDLEKLKKTQGELLFSIGKVYEYQGNYPEALKYLSQTLDIYQSIKYEIGIADTYLSMATIHYNER